MAQLQLLGIAGSLRKASYNRALIRAIGEELPDGATLSLYDGLAALPVFDPDSKDNPDVVIAFQEAIRAADGLVIATPEYNYSISGLLKNALDWATRPLKTSPMRGKPVGIASASTGISGGMRAQYHLRQILVFTDSPAMLQPEVMLSLQAFMLGSTALVGWSACAVMVLVWLACMPLAMALGRVLDGLSLGEATAVSLGLPLPRVRVVLVATLALATGAAVAQTGLIAFVGLAAPHLVRSIVRTTHRRFLLLASLMGGVLLLGLIAAVRRRKAIDARGTTG